MAKALKGHKIARFDLIPWDCMWRVAERYGAGTELYADRGWEEGYEWGKAIAALHRHMAQFCMANEEEDHLAAVVFYALALMRFEESYLEGDDRG